MRRASCSICPAAPRSRPWTGSRSASAILYYTIYYIRYTIYYIYIYVSTLYTTYHTLYTVYRIPYTIYHILYYTILSSVRQVVPAKVNSKTINKHEQ